MPKPTSVVVVYKSSIAAVIASSVSVALAIAVTVIEWGSDGEPGRILAVWSILAGAAAATITVKALLCHFGQALLDEAALLAEEMRRREQGDPATVPSQRLGLVDKIDA